MSNEALESDSDRWEEEENLEQCPKNKFLEVAISFLY